MASGDTIFSFGPTHWSQVAGLSNPQMTFVNNHRLLAFDPSTDENCRFTGIMGTQYAGGGGITVTICWTANATTGNAIWVVRFEQLNTSSDLDTLSFDTTTSATLAGPTTAYRPVYTTISIADADTDAIAAGESFRFEITRDADNGSDTLTVDALLISIEGRET